MFIKGGSPGHCVMVADVAENRDGSRCFLAQGYMPAQEFQIIKIPFTGTILVLCCGTELSSCDAGIRI